MGSMCTACFNSGDKPKNSVLVVGNDRSLKIKIYEHLTKKTISRNSNDKQTKHDMSKFLLKNNKEYFLSILLGEEKEVEGYEGAEEIVETNMQHSNCIIVALDSNNETSQEFLKYKSLEYSKKGKHVLFIINDEEMEKELRHMKEDQKIEELIIHNVKNEEELMKDDGVLENFIISID